MLIKQEHKVFANRLEAGYVYTSTGDLYPLEWCDFELYEHGENGTPPTDHSFSFKAGKGTTHLKILKHSTELQIIVLLKWDVYDVWNYWKDFDAINRMSTSKFVRQM